MYYSFYIFIFGILFKYGGSSNPKSDYGPCITPDHQTGRCIFLQDCPELEQLLDKDNLTDNEAVFIRQSECLNVDTSEAVVCCKVNNSSPSLLPVFPDCGIQGSSTTDRIFGGNITNIMEYPWMALLLYTREGASPIYGCGGALINNRYILTAAHCITSMKKNRKKYLLSHVRLGEWDTNSVIDVQDGIIAEPVVEVEIEETIVHESYSRNIISAYHDIALLRLANDVNYTDFIKPICIHRIDDLLLKDISKIEMFAAGWGYTENNTVSHKKLAVGLFGKSLEHCNSKYAITGINLHDTQLCAGGDQGMDTCSGDSGGPLVALDKTKIPLHFYIVGVISFGPVPCGLQGYPGVYTKVFKYVNWIESKLRP